MITTSDIIVKLVKDNGYRTLEQFSETNKISPANFAKAVRDNMWTEGMLKKVGKILGKDLSRFVTAKVGVSKGVKYYEK
jgi:hypothetical protein